MQKIISKKLQYYNVVHSWFFVRLVLQSDFLIDLKLLI